VRQRQVQQAEDGLLRALVILAFGTGPRIGQREQPILHSLQGCGLLPGECVLGLEGWLRRRLGQAAGRVHVCGTCQPYPMWRAPLVRLLRGHRHVPCTRPHRLGGMVRHMLLWCMRILRLVPMQLMLMLVQLMLLHLVSQWRMRRCVLLWRRDRRVNRMLHMGRMLLRVMG
jgi:hypothetical protein